MTYNLYIKFLHYCHVYIYWRVVVMFVLIFNFICNVCFYDPCLYCLKTTVQCPTTCPGYGRRRYQVCGLPKRPSGSLVTHCKKIGFQRSRIKTPAGTEDKLQYCEFYALYVNSL